MFDKYMVLTRGFQNVRENGRIVGFRMLVRITYYRGVYLPIVGGFQVKVDGEEFPASRMTFTVGGRAFTMEEMGKAEKVRWPFGEPAVLTISKPGGLTPGIHEVEVTETLNPSYVPKGVFVGHTKRRMTLVA